jgi:membrane protein
MAANLFSLNGLTLNEVVKRTWTEIRADDVFGRAAQLAYYFFLALFPSLICVIASLSLFGFADRGRMLMFQVFARFLPAPAFQLIGATIDQIIQANGPVKMSFGIIASLELTCGIGVMLIVSLLTVVFGDDVVTALFSGDLVFAIWKIAKWPLGLALLALVFEITYYFAPDINERDWRWITPGTLTGIFFLLVASIGSRIYLRYSSSYGAAYGSLGAVIVLLLWFYLSGIALLSGGVLNGILENPTASPSRQQPQNGAPT